jgi:cobalt-precorrin 5A hydrolase
MACIDVSSSARRADSPSPATARTHVNRILPADPLPDASAPADNALALGIGCRSGVTLAQIEAAVQAQLGNRGDGGDWTLAQVKVVATLDAKAAEPALLAFCAAHALPLRTFTREQVASVEAHAVRSAPSAAAQARFGVAGVCEPCACLAAAGGPLVRAKLALDGVTVALAAFANQVTPKPQD